MRVNLVNFYVGVSIMKPGKSIPRCPNAFQVVKIDAELNRVVKF